MPLLGQASGAFTESSSALRVLHGGTFNSVGILTDDAFTQSNPPVSTGTAVSTQVDTAVTGVLSGSVAFARPDVGSNFIGGPASPGGDIDNLIVPLGLFVNSAAGNPFENQPAAASGKLTYMSGQGTYGDGLFETQALAGGVTGFASGDPITYTVGSGLLASVNGYLLPATIFDGATARSTDVASWTLEVTNGNAASTNLGVVKLPPDSVQDEVVFDMRV